MKRLIIVNDKVAEIALGYAEDGERAEYANLIKRHESGEAQRELDIILGKEKGMSNIMKRIIMAGILLALVALTCSSPTEPEDALYLFAYGTVYVDEKIKIPMDEVHVYWFCWNCGGILGKPVAPDTNGHYEFYTYYRAFHEGHEIYGGANWLYNINYSDGITFGEEHRGPHTVELNKFNKWPIRHDFHLKYRE